MKRPSPVAAALVLTAVFLPVSIALSNVALGLLTAALLWRARTDGRRLTASWRAEPALAALILYGAAGLVAAALSAFPEASLRDAVKDWHRLWSLGLFVAALAVEPEAPVLPALGISFAAMAAIGLVELVLGGEAHGTLTRAHGFVHPVVYGEQMALGLLGTLCLLLRPERRLPRRATALLASLTGLALLASQTRMALFGAAAGFAALILRAPRARRWILPAVVLTGGAIAAWQVLPTGGRTLTAVLAPYNPNNPQQARWALWDAAWRMFRDHPATGVGPSGYRVDFHSYHSEPVDGSDDWGSAHNLYLHQLAERGLLGGAALLVLLWVLFRRASAAARGGNAAALWAFASVPAFAVMALTETSFQNEQFAALLLLIWALGTAVLRERREIL
jgi:O-antigen ligase